MLIHIDNIPEEGLTLELEEPATAFPVLANMEREKEAVFCKPVRIRLHVATIEGMVNVSGTIDTKAIFHCSRCLDECETSIESSFELTYVKELPDIEGDEDDIEVSPEEMGLILYTGDTIDLREAVQQEVIMALPFRPLCEPECKGLCPRCGANLNRDACDCHTTDFSLKFAALKNFKVDKKQ